jgi:2-keto-4-pentenoate hydratase/2-oxohepta-3-ene-1,7-dioic acid hydratase in catechol pathway
MKLFRFGQQGQEKPGVFLSNGSGVDVSGFCSDYSEAFFASGGLDTLSRWLRALASSGDVPNPGQLNLWLKVNGELRQNGNTSDMIFDVSAIVSDVSEFMTLLPGDVIGTGTLAGVGLGRPQRAISSLAIW